MAKHRVFERCTRRKDGRVEAIDLMHMLEFTGARVGILIRCCVIGKFAWYEGRGWLCTSTEAMDGCDGVRFDDSCASTPAEEGAV